MFVGKLMTIEVSGIAFIAGVPCQSRPDEGGNQKHISNLHIGALTTFRFDAWCLERDHFLCCLANQVLSPEQAKQNIFVQK